MKIIQLCTNDCIILMYVFSPTKYEFSKLKLLSYQQILIIVLDNLESVKYIFSNWRWYYLLFTVNVFKLTKLIAKEKNP